MNQFNHFELTQIAAKWLKKQGFPIIVSELKTTIREIPDAIGFRSCSSLLIECKCSRADFLVDFKKPERSSQSMGVGNYRLYMAEEGVLKHSDMPSGWGLLEVDNKGKVKISHFKQGNLWVGNDFLDNTKEHYTLPDDHREFLHHSNIENERRILFSALRRNL